MSTPEKGGSPQRIHESSTKLGVSFTESTATTKRHKHRKKSSKRGKPSGQASPAGGMSEVKGSASSLRKASPRRRTSRVSQEEQPPSTSQSASVPLIDPGVSQQPPVAKPAIVVLPDTPPKRASSPGSIHTEAEAVSTSRKAFDSLPNINETDEAETVTRVIVALVIAAAVGCVIFSMVFNGQRSSKRFHVADVTHPNATDPKGNSTTPVNASRSRSAHKLDLSVDDVSQHQKQGSSA